MIDGSDVFFIKYALLNFVTRPNEIIFIRYQRNSVLYGELAAVIAIISLIIFNLRHSSRSKSSAVVAKLRGTNIRMWSVNKKNIENKRVIP